MELEAARVRDFARWALIVPLLACAATQADEPPPLNDSSFEFELDTWEEAEESFWSSARFTLGHELAVRRTRSDTSDWTNNRSSFRLEYERHVGEGIFLRLDTKLTAFLENDHRAEAHGRKVHSENLGREAYAQYSRGAHSLRFGRQILIWGESEVGAITDVISPRNFSELFFISLEESRIGQNMISYERFSGTGEWSAFVVPEASFNRYPRAGTAYEFESSDVVALDAIAERSEFGGRWRRSSDSIDLSLMAARLISNDPVFSLDEDGNLRRDSQRFDMLGAAINHSRGNALFAAEFAHKAGLAFATDALQTVERSTLDLSLRGEYALGKGGSHSLGLELANSHVRNWDAALRVPRNQSSIALVWNNMFFNDTLTANVLAIANHPYSSSLFSAFLSYKWDDRISLNLDAFHISTSDPRAELYPFRGQSTLVFRVLYQF
ncbi:DUF1302 family protein [Aquimonas sp.]|uniref:DUF1302 family protein n=1 Tax=Aquimonas sp. TaxID=1872588 RepID=UPI0037C11043